MPARADAEDHVVLLDGFQVAPLVDALGLHTALAKRALLAGFGQTAQGGRGVGRQHPDHVAEVAVHKAETVAVKMLIVGKHLFGAVDIAGRSVDLDGVCAQVDGDVQAVFEQAQVFVAGAKQGFDIRADFDVRSSSRVGVMPPGAWVIGDVVGRPNPLADPEDCCTEVS